MFGLFSNKKITIDSPIQGKVIDITKVNDKAFSSKMMGDGFAVEPENNVIIAPCDGKIVVLAETKHAVAIESTEGIQVLIHIGLDTVELAGNGFTTYVEQGANVKRGDKLISFNIDYIKSKGKSLTTMLIIINMDEKVKKLNKDITATNGILQVEVK